MKTVDSETPATSAPKSMTKSKMMLLGVAVLVGLASFGVAYAMSQRGGAAKTATTATCKGNCVYLKADGASPDIVTVTAGSFVEFVAADGKSHNIAAVEHDRNDKAEHTDEADHADKTGGHNDLGYKSGEFAADEAWRVQFKKDGAYTFADKLNPKIHVNVIVYTEGKEYKVQ